MVGALSFSPIPKIGPIPTPRHPRFRRGLAKFGASRLVLARLNR